MGNKGREIVGMDIDELQVLLRKAYADEWLASDVAFGDYLRSWMKSSKERPSCRTKGEIVNQLKSRRTISRLECRDV